MLRQEISPVRQPNHYKGSKYSKQPIMNRKVSIERVKSQTSNDKRSKEEEKVVKIEPMMTDMTESSILPRYLEERERKNH